MRKAKQEKGPVDKWKTGHIWTHPTRQVARVAQTVPGGADRGRCRGFGSFCPGLTWNPHGFVTKAGIFQLEFPLL